MMETIIHLVTITEPSQFGYAEAQKQPGWVQAQKYMVGFNVKMVRWQFDLK